ncbi:SLC13 family permease [Desulfobulbus propionicus]
MDLSVLIRPSSLLNPAASMPHPEMLIPLATLACAATLMITSRIRADLVAVLVVLALMLSGVLSPTEALAGFSNPVVIIIACMFVVSEAIIHTGIAQRMGDLVLARGGTSEVRLLIMLMSASCLLGSFMSSTATAAIFIPIVLTVAEKAGINHKRLLIPLAVAALISGMMTLVATPPNIAVNNVLRERGLEPLSFFSFTPFGLICLALAIGFMVLCGRHLLAPQKPREERRPERSIQDLIYRYGLDQRLALLQISGTSELIDRSVARMQLAARHHLHLIALHTPSHGGGSTVPARPESVFEEGHILVVIGAVEDIERFRGNFSLIKREPPSDPALKRHFFQVIGAGEVMLTPDSSLIGKSIREIGFHTQFHCLALAIRRKGETMTTDFADEPLLFGDVLLICGAWEDILRLRQHRDQYILLTLPQDFREVVPARGRAPLALAIIAAMVGLIVCNTLPTVTAILGATVALILTRCVKPDAWFKAVDWPTIILVAGILPLATALQKTGVSTVVSHALLTEFGHSDPLLVLAVLFLVTAGIGLFLSNTPTALLAAPMAIDIGQAMGVSPQACAMTVAIACSAAFVSPLGSPVTMIVREPGGYRLMDFARVGAPLVLLCMVATVCMAWLMYLR